MKYAKVVIGANYGDEGKGLMTSYFAQDAKKNGFTCLNILFNGGPQRGHTVEKKDGFRHIYHAFGAGEADGADTYYNKHFMVNPFIFLSEAKELNSKTRVWVNYDCEITTPFDVLMNQALEKSRGNNRHGSCGCGIFETFHRVNEGFSFQCKDLMLSRGELIAKIKFVRDKYFTEKRMKELDITFPIEWRKDFFGNDILLNFINDLMEFKQKVYFINSLSSIADYYDVAIFEGGQGLALDMGNRDGWPHLTPSHTGSDWVIEELKELDKNFSEHIDIEVCYVSRTYFTRHGAGELKGEVGSYTDLGIVAPDNTNITNDWQGSIRYAPFDDRSYINRISADEDKWLKYYVDFSQVLTHLNELNGFNLYEANTEADLYLSASKYPEEVLRITVLDS